MRNTVALVIGLCTSGAAFGQDLWSVSDTFVPLTGTTSSGVLHNYAEIESSLPADEVFIWRANFHADFPMAWNTFFQDPQTWHNPLVHQQEESFILNAENPFLNKLILQVMHNGYPGNGQVTITVFPQENVADSTQIHYNISVTGPLLSNSDIKQSALRIYPNPVSADGLVRVNYALPFTIWQVVSADGSLVKAGNQVRNGWIETGHLSPGVYVLQLPELGIAERIVVH